jgi:hypothetical protein
MRSRIWNAGSAGVIDVYAGVVCPSCSVSTMSCLSRPYAIACRTRKSAAHGALVSRSCGMKLRVPFGIGRTVPPVDPHASRIVDSGRVSSCAPAGNTSSSPASSAAIMMFASP